MAGVRRRSPPSHRERGAAFRSPRPRLGRSWARGCGQMPTRLRARGRAIPLVSRARHPNAPGEASRRRGVQELPLQAEYGARPHAGHRNDPGRRVVRGTPLSQSMMKSPTSLGISTDLPCRGINLERTGGRRPLGKHTARQCPYQRTSAVRAIACRSTIACQRLPESWWTQAFSSFEYVANNCLPAQAMPSRVSKRAKGP